MGYAPRLSTQVLQIQVPFPCMAPQMMALKEVFLSYFWLLSGGSGPAKQPPSKSLKKSGGAAKC